MHHRQQFFNTQHRKQALKCTISGKEAKLSTYALRKRKSGTANNDTTFM